jgi:Ca-activated chloride channel family protein
MPDAGTIPFHLLRPFWLLALVPVVLILALVVRRQRADVRWGDVIAPHLLAHLIVRPARRLSVNPAYLVATGLVLGIVALSGPTWRRELPPFVADQAPLMIALSVSSSMNQHDIAPSRLERAKQKIRDLLAARAGARTGLIAYAGTAHLVMPLSDDRAVIEPFLAALSPALMPTDGKNAVAAVALATDALATEAVPGTILIITDDLSGADEKAVRSATGRSNLLILGMLPPQADSAMATGLRADMVRVSVDGADVLALERRIETRFQAAQGATSGARWHDEGYWLLIPAALLCALWFRRGTAVQWIVLLGLMLQAVPARADDMASFRSLWLTPDQQGRLAFDRGDYATAKTLFTDPMWRGIAAYRAYDFLAAAEAFQSIATSDGRFALGNAQAQNHAYDKAIAAYDEVLKAQPNRAAAKLNRDIVLAALKQQEAKRQQQEQGEPPPSLRPDETKVEPNQKGGKRIEITPQDVTTAGAAEAWMREVQNAPADFLKLKFAIQAAAPPEPKR